jgi:hypothetical protein
VVASIVNRTLQELRAAGPEAELGDALSSRHANSSARIQRVFGT